MATLTSQITILIFLLLSSITFHISMSSNNNLVRCNEKDRKALLIFKKGVIDRFDRLSTWTTEQDCCAWEGVYCNNISGRVTKLDLTAPIVLEGERFQYKSLEGEINFAILELEYLYYLDLSRNSFDVISSPTPILHNNITHASKSNLHILDLSGNDHLQMDDFHWLSKLSSLTYLDLSGIDLHKHANWLHELAILPLLSDLRMGYCNLTNFLAIPSLKYVNFSSLVHLDLSYNNFNSKLPSGLFNFTRDLSYLNLRGSNIHGEIPPSLLNLRNLSYLDISHNKFSGSIPSSLGNLSSLETLFIGFNYFSGEISEAALSKLSRLDVLDMTNSTIAFRFDPLWVPPFQLTSLFLANTNQGPTFPLWIYTQKSLQQLDLSSSGISFVDVNKVMSFVKGISSFLSLSNNSIGGDISNVTFNASNIHLDHNNFTGRLPHISPMAEVVDFSHNSFSGSIPYSWKNSKDLYLINLWSNRLAGNVLEHLFDMESLIFMNLGENEFSGTIPFDIPQKLRVIILRANQFEGNIPPQLFNLPSLFHLDLAYNKLHGGMPRGPYNMTQMIITKADFDYPIGTIVDLFTKGQHYLPNVSPDRRTIDLSANSLSGELPLNLFQLIQLQTLNLSHNNFSGIIPNMIGGMKYMESLDLSNNNFSGSIPQSLALLNFLGYLNLSCNNLNGKIPTGTQLQSFNASSYIGNPNLCGDPLKKCFIEEENPNNGKSSSRNQHSNPFKEALYQGMGVGFAAGFWGICGSLFLIRKWRHAFFRFFDQVTDKLYVVFMVKLNSFGKARPRAS